MTQTQLFPGLPATTRADLLRSFDAAVATAREARGSGEDESSAQQRIFALLARFALPPEECEQDPEVALRAALENSSAFPLRRELAVCIARLLPESTTALLSSHEWRHPVIRLLDSQLEEAYTEEIRSAPGHEKAERLGRLYQGCEEKFRDALANLTSLERYGACHTATMAALNGRASQVLLRPFLPDNVLARLGELQSRLKAYVTQRDAPSVVDARQALSAETSRFRRELAEHGTTYSSWLEIRLVAELDRLVSQEFAHNPAVRPATVGFSIADKAHPLHRKTSITIPVNIRNTGPGFAENVGVVAVVDKPGRVADGEVGVGRLRPLAEHRLDVVISMEEPAPHLQLLVQVSWKNFDGTQHQSEQVSILRAQRSGIDWSGARSAEPYSLEAAQSEQDLVGRREVLERLLGHVRSNVVGSAIIQGQKRVGKTSIARALCSSVRAAGAIAIYAEAGEYVDPTPGATIRQLAARIVRLLRESVPGAREVSPPSIADSLAPLGDFLEDVLAVAGGDARLLIVLDEFDELPRALYERKDSGHSFFLALRSLTSRPSIGIVLVGGERMRDIKEAQGDKLNKWTPVLVDYFSREADWEDYRELVQRPAAGVLDYTEEAIGCLHDETAGNPYFTHLLCREIFRAAAAREDCHVTAAEVARAVAVAERQVSSTAFQHFWEDGILEDGGAAGERSVRRRRVLIAMADALRTSQPCSVDIIRANPLVQEVNLDAELQELLNRGIVRGNATTGYDLKVPLFRRWLQADGVREILGTFEHSQWDQALSRRKATEATRVRLSELTKLVHPWGPYRGQVISEERVASWLAQFKQPSEERLMFKLLSGIQFYTAHLVRKKMVDVKGILGRALASRVGASVSAERGVLVSYLDGPAKSGAAIARLYVEENGMRAEDVVERSALADRLKSDSRVRALILLDDFVGTGSTAVTGLTDLHRDVGDLVRAQDIKVVFAAVAAYAVGWQRVRDAAQELKFGVLAHACDLMGEETSLFSQASKIFESDSERAAAKELVREHGARLEKSCPLGYGGFGLGVVFERACPNNSLPILWSESSSPKWVPLFKRL